MSFSNIYWFIFFASFFLTIDFIFIDIFLIQKCFHRLEPEPEVIYLRHVERARPHARPEDGDRVYPPPQFIVPLQDVTQTEGGKIHFEGRIEPVGDPTMYVEWFLNGRPLAASKDIV